MRSAYQSKNQELKRCNGDSDLLVAAEIVTSYVSGRRRFYASGLTLCRPQAKMSTSGPMRQLKA